MAKKRSRANGEGSIYKDKDGVWWAQRYIPGGGYLRRRAMSHAEIVRKMAELQKIAVKPKKETRDKERTILAVFAESWLDGLESELQPKTMRGYRWVLNSHVLPILGKSKIAEIEHGDIQDMANKLAKKVGRATVVQCVGTLHSLLEDARKRGIRPPYVNPAKGIRLPKKRDDSNSKPLTETQFASLFRVAQSMHSPIREVILFAMFTGARNSEMRGIRWADITESSHGQVVRIGGQLESVHTGKYRTTRDGEQREVMELQYKPQTKTKKVRYITVEPLVETAFDALRKAQEVAGVYSPDGFVFLQEPRFAKSNHDLLTEWRPVSETVMGKYFRKAYELAGCPGHCVHDLRHTFTTLTLSEGVDTHSTQKTLGHSHQATTSDIYAGQTIRAAKLATSAITEIIERNLTETEG